MATSAQIRAERDVLRRRRKAEQELLGAKGQTPTPPVTQRPATLDPEYANTTRAVVDREVPTQIFKDYVGKPGAPSAPNIPAPQTPRTYEEFAANTRRAADRRGGPISRATAFLVENAPFVGRLRPGEVTGMHPNSVVAKAMEDGSLSGIAGLARQRSQVLPGNSSVTNRALGDKLNPSLPAASTTVGPGNYDLRAYGSANTSATTGQGQRSGRRPLQGPVNPRELNLKPGDELTYRETGVSPDQFKAYVGPDGATFSDTQQPGFVPYEGNIRYRTPGDIRARERILGEAGANQGLRAAGGANYNRNGAFSGFNTGTYEGQVAAARARNANARARVNQIAGASEGGSILRDINKLNERAGRAYSDAIGRGLNSKAAARAAGAIQAQADNLVNAQSNLVRNRGNELRAASDNYGTDAYRERTALDSELGRLGLQAKQAQTAAEMESLASERNYEWMSELATFNGPDGPVKDYGSLAIAADIFGIDPRDRTAMTKNSTAIRGMMQFRNEIADKLGYLPDINELRRIVDQGASASNLDITDIFKAGDIGLFDVLRSNLGFGPSALRVGQDTAFTYDPRNITRDERDKLRARDRDR